MHRTFGLSPNFHAYEKNIVIFISSGLSRNIGDVRTMQGRYYF